MTEDSGSNVYTLVMPLLLLIFALFIPRVVIVLLWMFSTWFQGAFDTFIIPVLGFIFLPYTLLWYTVVQNSFGGEWGIWQIVFLAIALLFDLAPAGRKMHRS